MNETNELRSQVLLSVQRALVGAVTDGMRAVAVQFSPRRITVHVYNDGPMSPEAVDDFEADVITQLIADFPYPEKEDPTFDAEYHSCPSPSAIPLTGKLVFARAGERFAAA